jgi:uncharacterized protein
MKVAIAGNTGLIGSKLSTYLKKLGHEVIAISHEGDRLILTDAHLDIDAVVNLSGVNIMQRWTSDFKKHALASRAGTSHDINHFYDDKRHIPKVFVSASAIGYYGNQPGETLIESSPKGEGFLSDLVAAWEKATLDSPIPRVVCFRLGVVLSDKGGMMPSLLKAARRRLAMIFGHEQSYLSWIHIDDAVRAFASAIEQSSYKGIYNLVSEESVTQKHFIQSVCKLLKRKVLLKLPRFIVTLIFGEASEVILNDAKVFPKKLKQSGFDFHYPDLDSALCSLVKPEP